MVAMLKTTDQTGAASSFSQSAALITPSSAMPPRKDADLSTYVGRCAQRLHELREASGLSVEEVATLTGKSKRAVYDWESGKSSPSVEIFPILANAYGLTSTRDLLPKE